MCKQTDSSQKNESIDLILRAKSGDQAAFEELLTCYAPLIDSLAAQFTSALPTAEDTEDLRQEAVIGFYSALMHFDAEQSGVRFGLYAKECIRNSLLSHLRRVKRHKAVLLLEDSEGEDTADESDPAQDLVDEENFLQLSHLIRKVLSPYENRIWWLYLSGRTAKEIAMMLGKDEKSVQNAVYRIRRKLREIIPYA